jgi:hypothetical protein
VRLVHTDIPTDDLEAAQTLLGSPGAVVEDDDLESCRSEVSRALEAIDDDNSYQDRLEDAYRYAGSALLSLDSFEGRVRALHMTGHLRVGNATAAAVIASCVAVRRALDDWLDWARRELADLD